MEQRKIYMVAPQKLQGLGEELSKIQNYCGSDIYLQMVGFASDLSQFETEIEEGTIQCDCLLVFDVASDTINPAKSYTRLFLALKTLTLQKSESRMRIFVILNEKRDLTLQLVNELVKIQIYNVHLLTDTFTTDDVVSWIMEPDQKLCDVEQFVSPDFNQPRTKVIEKIVEVEVPVPVEIPVEIEVPVTVETPAVVHELKERKPFWRRRKKETKQERTGAKGACVIGIVGAARGIGATSCCVDLAKHFSKNHKTALIECNENRQLSTWEAREQVLKQIAFYEGGSFREYWKEYDYIVVDYGAYLKLAPGTEFIEEVLLSQTRMTELLFCDHIILAGSPVPWRMPEISFYATDPVIADTTKDWIFYLPGGETSQIKLRARHVITGLKEDALKALINYISEQ